MDAAVAKVLGWTNVGLRTMVDEDYAGVLVAVGYELRGVPPAGSGEFIVDPVGGEAWVPSYSTSAEAAWHAMAALPHWRFRLQLELHRLTVQVWQGDAEIGWAEGTEMPALVCQAILCAEHEARNL